MLGGHTTCVLLADTMELGGSPSTTTLASIMATRHATDSVTTPSMGSGSDVDAVSELSLSRPALTVRIGSMGPIGSDGASNRRKLFSSGKFAGGEGVSRLKFQGGSDASGKAGSLRKVFLLWPKTLRTFAAKPPATVYLRASGITATMVSYPTKEKDGRRRDTPSGPSADPAKYS
jgi:hypothetical protein